MIEVVIVTLLIIVIFLVLTLLCRKQSTLENFNNYSLRTKPVTIAMCVPCYPPDTSELDQLMESVRKLTVKPDEIIIGHSEMSPEEAKKLEKKFEDLQIKVVSTPKQQYAADNREMAALQATSDYISFMDADDVIVPFRFEMLTFTILIDKPKAILHSYYENKIPETYTRKIKQKVYGDTIYDFYQKTDSPVITDYIVTHGHVTIKKEVLEQIPLRKGKEFHGKEDALYVRDIVEHYGRKKDTIVFLDIPLSVYFP